MLTKLSSVTASCFDHSCILYFFLGGCSRPVPGLWWPHHDWAAGAHDAGSGIRHHDHRLLAREARHQQNSSHKKVSFLAFTVPKI
jgi:hypothetical protein